MKATVTWLSRVVINTSQASAAIRHAFSLWDRYTKTRGLTWTVHRWKSMRLCVTRYLCDQPLRVVDGMGIRADGLPRALGPVNDLIRSGSPIKIKFALTLLSISRPIEGPIKPNLDSITTPWSGSLHPGLLEFLPRFVEGLKKPLTEWEAPHWSTKQGPNGHALMTCIEEFLSLPYWLIQALKILGGPDFVSYYNKIHKIVGRIKLKEPKRLRKLSFIRDKEMKTRTIAILDYWSQTVLKPFHDSVMEMIRHLPGDFTYQGDVRQHLDRFQGTFYSFDLKDATDRFPMQLQKELFSLIFGPDQSKAWEAVMVGLPYEYKLPSGETGHAKYMAGQPMGAYSSWAVFTLTHHAILQYIVSIHPEVGYAILGDDIVIRGENGARLYQEVMDTLGVPISENKTHVSLHGFEFAKRWFLDGHEVTPFPLWSLIEAGANPVKLVTAFLSVANKGWPVEIICRPGVIRDYLVQVLGLYSRVAAGKARHAINFKDLLTLIKSNDEPVQLSEKVAGLAHRLIEGNGQSGCNHNKHLIGSLQRAFNDTSARMAHDAVTVLDQTASELVGGSLQSLPPALANVHPARLASEHLLEVTSDGALFYRDLAAYHRAGLRTTGIPLEEKFSSLSRIVPLARFPLPDRMFDRVAVRVMNTEARFVEILIQEWKITLARPEDQNLRSAELGRVLANASQDLHRSN